MVLLKCAGLLRGLKVTFDTGRVEDLFVNRPPSAGVGLVKSGPHRRKTCI